MVKFISATEAAQFFENDQSVMIGGFLKCGSPTMVIDELLKTSIKNYRCTLKPKLLHWQRRSGLYETNNATIPVVPNAVSSGRS